MTSESQGRIWPLWLRITVVAAVALALIIPVLVWRDQLLTVFANREQVAALIRAAGAWGPALIIGFGIAQTIVAPIPGQMTNFVAGYIYGPWLGLLYSWIGLICGTALAMLLARYAGRPVVKHLVSPAMLEKIDRLAAGKGLGFFFLFFLIPGLPDDLLCFVIGLTALPLRIMLPMAAIARLPGMAGAVWLGATAERIPPVVWVVLAVLGLVVAVLFWRYGDQFEDFMMHRIWGRSHER